MPLIHPTETNVLDFKIQDGRTLQDGGFLAHQPDDAPAGWRGRIGAALVYDGGDAVRVPTPMGDPRDDQMQGTWAQRLIEVAGRVCYDGETEVLTRGGWVKFRDLISGVEVATYNSGNDNMEFQTPTDYIRKPYIGEMYRVNTTKVSLFVTPDHDLFVGSASGKTWSLCKAKDLAGTKYLVRRRARYLGSIPEPIVMRGLTYRQTHLNKTGKASVRTVADEIIAVHQMSAWATVLGYYVSEGTLNMNAGNGSAPYVSIYQKRANMQPILNAAAGCGLPARVVHVDKRNDVAQIRVAGSTLARYLLQFGKGSRNKRLPHYVFEWPCEQRERLLDALMAGDGHTTKCGVRVYNTNSRGLADDVQRLIVSLGRAATINYSKCKTCLMYRIRETAHDDVSVNKHHRQDAFVPYDGEVFCVSVPNRILVTRRDGKVALCGNCYDSMGAGRSSEAYRKHLLDVGHGSVLEHASVTLRASIQPYPTECLAFAQLLANRPGVYWRSCPDGDNGVYLTINARAAREFLKSGFDCSLYDRQAVLVCDAATRILEALKEEFIGLLGHRPRGIYLEVFSEKPHVVSPEAPEEKWITLYLEGSRIMSHELVRHRHQTAMSQRSGRYCDESESEWVLHPALTTDDAWKEDYDRAARRYGDCVRAVQPRMEALGISKTDARKQARSAARGILGNAMQTALIFSASVAQWRHMLRMRAANAADAEIRNLFSQAILPVLKASRYGQDFADLETAPASDGLGLCLKDGGAE